MSESLVFYSEMPFSQKKLKDWLALPFTSDQEASTSVIDGLADYLAYCCGTASQNHLLCRYDKTAKTLQFAACLHDGSTTEAKEQAQHLKDLWLAIDSCPKKPSGKKAPLAADTIVAWSDDEQAQPDTKAEPAWFLEWLEDLPLLGEPFSQGKWIDRAILQRLADMNAVADASPENPVWIGWVYTDGTQVFANVAGKTIVEDDPAEPDGQRMRFTESVLYVLEGASPKTMRALTDYYYTDGNMLWHCNIFSGNAPQALAYCEGQTPRIYKFTDSTVDTLITLGDSAWSISFDDSKPPHERYHVKHTEIDGASFARLAKTDVFQDRLNRYRFDERYGLLLQTAPDADESAAC